MYPHERSLVERLKDQPFALIGVNSDSKERVKTALQRENISWRSFWDGGSTGGPIAREWGVRAWPTIYVIDDQGVVRYKNVRGPSMDTAVNDLLERSIVLLAEKVKSEDPEVRGLAAFRMGKYKVPEAKSTLTHLLNDNSSLVQSRAATGLALLGQPVQSWMSLVRLAVKDSDSAVRVGALQSLATAGDPEATPLVIASLDDEVVDVRRAAVQALAELRTPAAPVALAKMVNDKDRQTAKMAVLSLAEIGSRAAVERLEDLAGKTEHPLRVWIAVALHKTGSKGTPGRFHKYLNDDQIEIRREAVSALAELQGFDATDLYIKSLDDGDSEIRKMARVALATSEDPHVLEALKRSLAVQVDDLVAQLGDASKRTTALHELQQLGPEAAPLLLDQLDGQSSSMTRYYLSSLVGQLGNVEIIPRIVERLSDSNVSNDVRYPFEHILRTMGSKARPAIDQLAEHDADVARESGMRLLATYHDAAAVKTQKTALKDPSARVRTYAAYGLSSSKDEDALSVLLETVKGSDTEARSTAVYALANYSAKIALPLLVELSQESDRSVRSTAIRAMSRLKDKEATVAIVEASRNDAALQSSAISALRSQDTPHAARALGEFLKSESSSIRRRAESYLKRMRTPEAKKVLEETERPEPTLQDRVSGLHQSSVTDQRKIFTEVQDHLTGRRLGRTEYGLAMGTAKGLERAGNLELSAAAYAAFGKLFSELEDDNLARYGKKMLGSARRVKLLGNEMEIQGTTVDGRQFNWKSYRGKVVLVDFWATWCGPCIAELPNVKKNYELYHDKGFEIVAISLDTDRGKLEKFLEEKNLPWVCLFEDQAGWDHSLAMYYGVMSIPTVFLVDQQGKVVSLNARGAELGTQLEKLLGPAQDGSSSDQSPQR